MTDKTDMFDAFALKVYDNVFNTADPSSVQRYLEVMVEEYQHQVKHFRALDNTPALLRAMGMLMAYEDCLRVLDIAADSALRNLEV